MFIYKIVNKINGKIYIGQTLMPIHRRWAAHCAPSSKCRLLNRAIAKYGKANFEVSLVIEAKSPEELNELEHKYVKSLDTLTPNGYNLKDGGGSVGALSAETKQLMSQVRLGSNNHMYGKKHSDEVKQKIKDARKGQIRSKGLAGIPVEGTCLLTNTIVNYSSISEATKDGFSIGCIARCCKGERSTHKNYRWRYING